MAEENYCYAASGLAGRSAHFAWGSLLKLLRSPLLRFSTKITGRDNRQVDSRACERLALVLNHQLDTVDEIRVNRQRQVCGLGAGRRETV